MASLYHLLIGYICFTQIIHGQELTILVCEWNPGQVFHLSLSARKMQSVRISNITRPVAIDYDPQTKDIYWSDVMRKEIRAINILGTNERRITALDTSAVPDGLAVDAANRKVFFTDSGYDVIVSMEMDGTNKTDVINSGLDNPRAIVLHEELRKFYYTDWGVNPFIATADYNGGSRTTIVTSGLGWPNGLTLDKQNGILYWCDAKTHKIESVNVNGTSRRLIIFEDTAHYFDIFFNLGTLYFTDWTRRAVFIIPANGGTVGHIASESGLFNHLAGIHVFSTLKTSACSAGQYGTACEDCVNCKNNSACEKTTGFCLGSCDDGYQGWSCRKCSAGTYGESCKSKCGNCVAGDCHHVDGRCLNGCTPGWQGFDCKTESCPTNRYGLSCILCGRCADGDVCNSTSGNCPSGCQPGWTGDRCDRACAFKTYGQSCTPCGKCAAGVACNSVTGDCPGECQDGWTGSKCNTKCSSGTFGTRCQSVCGNCLGGLCNHVDGRCENGCTSGWQGTYCKTVKCQTKSYGPTCVPCGRCANGDACDPVTGFCQNGCMDGWTGDKCDSACPPKTYSSSCTDCGQCRGGESCDRVNGACPNGCQDGWQGVRCKTEATDSGPSVPLMVVIGASAGGVAVLLIVVIIIIIVAVVVLRRKKNPKPEPNEDPHYATLDSVRHSNIYSVPYVPPPYSTIMDAQSRDSRNGYTDLKETRIGVANLGFSSHQSPEQDSDDYLEASAQSVTTNLEDESVRYQLAVAKCFDRHGNDMGN